MDSDLDHGISDLGLFVRASAFAAESCTGRSEAVSIQNQIHRLGEIYRLRRCLLAYANGIESYSPMVAEERGYLGQTTWETAQTTWETAQTTWETAQAIFGTLLTS